MSLIDVTVVTAPDAAHFETLKGLLRGAFNGRVMDGPLGVNEKYKFATIVGRVSAAEKEALTRQGFAVAYERLGVL